MEGKGDFKKVLVLMGGLSCERDVSFETADFLCNTLLDLEYEVSKYDFKDLFDFVDYIKQNKPDVVVNALHGTYGEDGNIQGLLNLMKIPYTHSGVVASAIGMDKFVTKMLATSIGVATPPGVIISVSELRNREPMKRPFVIKPNDCGSSIGVSLIFQDTNVQDILDDFDNSEKVLVEQYIKGKDLVVGVLDGRALAITELVTLKGFYDYEAKYSNDNHAKHVLPARIPEDLTNNIKKEAEKMYDLIRARGVIRFDYVYNVEKKMAYMLEVNTQPGMTKSSTIQEQAKYVGMSHGDFVTSIIKGAKFE